MESSIKSLNTGAFQPCDIRGIFGPAPTDPINPYLVYLTAVYIAERTPEGEKVLLSGDGRSSTGVLLYAASLGLGKKALVIGNNVPTSQGYLAKQIYNAYSSMIITASHNPPDFNGVKLQIGNEPVTPKLMNDIKQAVINLAEILPEPDFNQPVEFDSALFQNVWQHYSSTVQSTFPTVENMTIALDCMFGCFSGIAGDLLENCGFKVRPIRNQLSEDFNGIIPDPAVSKNLTDLIQLVKSSNVAFGAALDGDGDRACFISEKGEIIDNGTVLVLIGKYLTLKNMNPSHKAVVYDQKIRLSVVNSLKNLGFNALREKSGHAFIRHRILQEQAAFGGEKSGHFFWNEIYPVPAGDCGLFAIFAIADLIRLTDKSLSQLAAEIPDSPFYTGDIRDLRTENRVAFLEYVKQHIPQTYSIDCSDGIRIELQSDDSTTLAFAHIRPSVTEADMLTAAFDAVDAESLSQLSTDVLLAIPDSASDIKNTIQQHFTTPI